MLLLHCPASPLLAHPSYSRQTRSLARFLAGSGLLPASPLCPEIRGAKVLILGLNKLGLRLAESLLPANVVVHLV